MGTDLGVSLSASGSATSGRDGDVFGDNIAGGSKMPKWFLPIVVGAFTVVAIVFLVRR